MRIFVICLFSILALQARADDELTLTAEETRELDERLRSFAEPGNAEAMSLTLPRRSVGAEASDPIIENKREVRQAVCREVARRYFPELGRSAKESVTDYDRLNQLTETWIASSELAWDPSRIPVVGRTRLPLWSADFWPTRRGALSFRYRHKKTFERYLDAIATYQQPADWYRLLAQPQGRLAVLDRWSPAEKWDVTVGDTKFSLTNHQKDSGRTYLDDTGDISSWIGSCHGWAAASIMMPAPNRAVNVIGASSARVRWLPDEVRALVGLAWSNAKVPLNYVGGRCNEKKPETYANGRLKQAGCFDVNPSTFYLALGNLIGRRGASVIMDTSFDKEVWNQPIHSYQIEYFNPRNPAHKSYQWREVAVPYNAAFKARDRFQVPLTRGLRKNGKYDDKAISKIVGARATVVYLYESAPSGTTVPTPNTWKRISYTFDLELYERNGQTFALGGEWHENTHPDFLWLPKKGASPFTEFDKPEPWYPGDRTPPAELTAAAAKGSQAGYPICRVLMHLANWTSGTNRYQCRGR